MTNTTKQTDGQTNIGTEGQTNRDKTVRQIGRWIHKDKQMNTDRQTNRWTHRQTDEHTDRQTNEHTDRQTNR